MSSVRGQERPIAHGPWRCCAVSAAVSVVYTVLARALQQSVLGLINSFVSRDRPVSMSKIISRILNKNWCFY